MRFFCAIFLALMLAPVLAAGQVVVEEEIQTDSIDLFTHVENPKSPALAMATSALLPGVGQQYLDSRGKALFFLTVEAALVFSLVYCNIASAYLEDDSKAFAWKYAAARGGAGAHDAYWELVGAFMDSDEYNRALELNRDEDIANRKYLADNLQWRWASDSLRQEYSAIREKASRLRTASSFVVAAMVLNRLFAFVDARVTARRSAAGIKGRFKAAVVPNAGGLSLHAEF